MIFYKTLSGGIGFCSDSLYIPKNAESISEDEYWTLKNVLQRKEFEKNVEYSKDKG